MQQMQESTSHLSSKRVVDEIDRARAQEYALLSILLSRSPDADMIRRVALLRGDASPLGIAHTALGEAAGLRGALGAGPNRMNRATVTHRTHVDRCLLRGVTPTHRSPARRPAAARSSVKSEVPLRSATYLM